MCNNPKQLLRLWQIFKLLDLADQLKRFTPSHIALVHDWLIEIGQLCIRIEWPHRGCSGETYTVKSLREVRSLFTKQNHDEIEIWIFKKPTLDDANFEHMTDDFWPYKNSDRVIFFEVKKNVLGSENYFKNPSRYADIIKEWAV